MEKNQEKFKKDFLQSEQWRKFQEVVGHKTFSVVSDNFSANIIEHSLPIVGKYFYVPKGPIISCSMKHETCSKKIQELINLAKKEKAGWIRIEPENNEILNLIKKNTQNKIIKAPHDMQPKETLIIDISKSEEEILAGMKSKTRYNIKLAQKHDVSVKAISNKNSRSQKLEAKSYLEEFLRLTKVMSERQGIKTHSDEYYRKMFEIIPENIIKLYVAEYDNQIIAANIVIFYGDTAIYLHGASNDEYRNIMAPYLLQWQAIKDAKEAGCIKYDLGGVKINNKAGKSWEGVTRFKLGFSPNTVPVEFPGCYDIIVNPVKYWTYRIIQKVKSFIR